MSTRRIIMDNSYESMKIELDQTKKQLQQKETENQELKRKLFEWKKMALENESLFQGAKHQYEIQEQHLIACHKSEMDALTSAHVEKMDDVSKTIISLQQSQQMNHDQPSKHIYDLVENKHKETASKVIYHRQRATNLILNMNELMTEIEMKIHGYVHTNDIDKNGQITNNEDDEINFDDQRSTLDYPQSFDPSLPQLDQPHNENVNHSFSSLSSPTFDDSYTSSPTSSRSSVSIEPISPPPRLKTKPTMEHLTKVIPNFLLKNTQSKPEQWKVTQRRSFIHNLSS